MINYLPLKEWCWLNEMDTEQRRNVIVLGNEVAKTLFPGRLALGAFILLNGIRFEVIGSNRHLGRGDNTWLNMRGYIPFPVMADELSDQRRERRELDLLFIEYEPSTTADHLLAKDDVDKMIARNHDFDVNDQNAYDEWIHRGIEDGRNDFRCHEHVSGAVGMVTLALGAIGVINIMLVAVSERLAK